MLSYHFLLKKTKIMVKYIVKYFLSAKNKSILFKIKLFYVKSTV